LDFSGYWQNLGSLD